MEPKIENILEEGGELKFTLSGVDVSIANGLRRAIISDISTYGFKTIPHEENQVNITKNTTRFNNEILKQRISCIPIHNIHNIPNHEEIHKDLVFEINEKNDSTNIKYITTEHIKIKNSKTNQYLNETDSKKIFPPNKITGDHILICRLKPKISDEIPGEELSFSANISVNTAKQNNMFNVSSTCFYNFTPDKVEQNKAWTAYLKENSDIQNKEDAKKNWYLHNGLRHYVKNSFDFTIETVGVYTNVELFKKGCQVLIDKITNCSSKLDDDTFRVEQSKSTIENCYDVILKNEDYTLGKVIEYYMYTNYFESNNILSYVGFRKHHPHDEHSVLRLGFKKPISNTSVVKEYIKNMNSVAIETYKQIQELIHSN